MGFPDAEEMLSKAGLVVQLTDLMSDRRISMSAAASQLGVSKGALVAIMDGQFQEYSIRELETFIETISATPRSRLRFFSAIRSRV